MQIIGVLPSLSKQKAVFFVFHSVTQPDFLGFIVGFRLVAFRLIF